MTNRWAPKGHSGLSVAFLHLAQLLSPPRGRGQTIREAQAGVQIPLEVTGPPGRRMAGPSIPSRPSSGSSSVSWSCRDGFVSGRALNASCLPAPPRCPKVRARGWGSDLLSSALTPAFNTPIPRSPVTSPDSRPLPLTAPRHLHVETLAGSSGSPDHMGLLSWAPHPIPHWPHPNCWVILVSLVLPHPCGSSFKMCHNATTSLHPR